jgi:hypothetical protein
LPLETEALAHMARMPIKHFTKLWENSVVKTCFAVGEDGRLHHKRLDEERDKQEQFRRRSSDNGKRGGRPRKEPVGSETETQNNPGLLETKAKKSSPISDLQSPVSRLPSPGGGGSKRPVFSGQRLTVFEWQLDELCKTLGPHADGFGLDEWFYAADRAALAAPLRPSREWWPWLMQATLAEAGRRGLPVARQEDPADAEYAALIRKGPSVRP